MRKITLTIGVLMGILFASCDNSGTPQSNSENVASEVNFTDLKVAYIYTDSVINNYEFYKQKSAEIADKGKRYEGELSSRARGFEQEVQNFQQSANNMTINQAKAKEEELVAKERNLVTYRDNVMQELSADETQLYNEVYDKIQDYLKQYAAENDLEMILSYTRGGGVWYADNTLDITNSVVAGINEAFKSTNTEEKAEPEAEEEN